MVHNDSSRWTTLRTAIPKRASAEVVETVTNYSSESSIEKELELVSNLHHDERTKNLCSGVTVVSQSLWNHHWQWIIVTRNTYGVHLSRGKAECMHASIACLLLYEDYVWVSLGNAMKAKQSKA